MLKKDPRYKPFGWESGTIQSRMQQYIRRTRDLSKVFKQGLADDEPQYLILHVRINVKSPWVYADCYSVHWYTWSKNFHSMQRSRGMGWKRSLKPVPTARGDLVTETKAVQNGWSPILKCCSHCSPLKLSSNCQDKLAHIQLFLDQYCSSPGTAFLCLSDVPSHLPALLSALQMEIKAPPWAEPCFSLAWQPGRLHPLQPPHSEFIPHHSGPPCTFLRHWKPECSAPFNGEGHSTASPTPCILPFALGGAEGELCLSPGWNSGHGREIYSEEWKFSFCRILLVPGFQHHASPLAPCDAAGLVQSHAAQHALPVEWLRPLYGAALCEGFWVLLPTSACPRSKSPQAFPIQPLLLVLKAAI